MQIDSFDLSKHKSFVAQAPAELENLNLGEVSLSIIDRSILIETVGYGSSREEYCLIVTVYDIDGQSAVDHESCVEARSMVEADKRSRHLFRSLREARSFTVLVEDAAWAAADEKRGGDWTI